MTRVWFNTDAVCAAIDFYEHLEDSTSFGGCHIKLTHCIGIVREEV